MPGRGGTIPGRGGVTAAAGFAAGGGLGVACAFAGATWGFAVPCAFAAGAGTARGATCVCASGGTGFTFGPDARRGISTTNPPAGATAATFPIGNACAGDAAIAPAVA